MREHRNEILQVKSKHTIQKLRLSEHYARVLPPLVMHEIMRAHRAQLRVGLVPMFSLDNLRLVDERTVIAQHAFVRRENRRGHDQLGDGRAARSAAAVADAGAARTWGRLLHNHERIGRKMKAVSGEEPEKKPRLNKSLREGLLGSWPDLLWCERSFSGTLDDFRWSNGRWGFLRKQTMPIIISNDQWAHVAVLDVLTRREKSERAVDRDCRVTYFLVKQALMSISVR